MTRRQGVHLMVLAQFGIFVALLAPVTVMNIVNALPQSLAGALGAFLLSIGVVGADNYAMLYTVAAVIALLGAAAIVPIRKVR